ncbi:MAG: hypothetical protein H8E66_06885 [Planctomycetes bacterium]|nr:hypothetical protein [Planctomycetota bacterium]
MRPLILSLCLLLALSICVLAAEVELSVPVRFIGPAPERQQPNMRATAERAESPTITRGLLPQYQSVTAFRSDVTKAPDPAKSVMRFFVALPDRMLLLDAAVTIDGKPFEMIRERRIDRIIASFNGEPQAVANGSVTDASGLPLNEEPDETLESEEEPVEEASEEETPEEASEEGAEPEVELISVPSAALEARLRRYATVTGRPPTRDEVRWLLTKWVDGPTLLLLDDNFQRFRAAQAPAFRVLDKDMDGTVSEGELNLAPETLRSCDVNQNDVVEYTEIAEVADDPRHKNYAAPVHAIVPILDANAVTSAFR